MIPVTDEHDNDNLHHRRLPFYSLEGTHYSYCYKLGQLTAERIKKRISEELDDLQSLFDFIKTDDGSKYMNCYTATIQDKVPWYYDEMKGLSDGSGVPLERILVLNYKNELKAAEDLSTKKEEDDQGRSSCSTVLINRLHNDEQLLYVAHNEDESVSTWNTSYILRATIRSSSYAVGKERETRKSPNEQFIAFGYAGQVPGNGFAANHHGFVFTYNGLYPKVPLLEHCLPRQIHNRIVLAVDTEEKLEDLMKTLLTAYGFNLNIGRFRYRDDVSQKYVWTYEIGPSTDDGKTNQYNINYVFNAKQIIDPQICTNKRDVSLSSFTFNFYYHFNHYLHLKTVDEQTIPISSSRMRTKRANEFNDIKYLDHALQLLGDEKYASEHPIFRRESTGQTDKVTVCTAVIDLIKAMMYVYDVNPAMTTSSPFLRYDLNSL